MEDEGAAQRPAAPPPFDDVAEWARQHEHPALACLAQLGPQTSNASRAVHVAPLQREDFPTSPAGEVAEVQHVAVLRWQMLTDREVLGMIHEPLTGLVLR